jgi:hypothetical protein
VQEETRRKNVYSNRYALAIFSILYFLSRDATRGADSSRALKSRKHTSRRAVPRRDTARSVAHFLPPPPRCDRWAGEGSGRMRHSASRTILAASASTIAAVKWNNLHLARTLHPDDAAATPHCVAQRSDRGSRGRGRWVGRSDRRQFATGGWILTRPPSPSAQRRIMHS